MEKESTGIDRVLEEVRRRHKVGIDDLSKKLKIEKGLIEEWAYLLEEKGLISIQFSMVRSPILLSREKAHTEIKGERPRVSKKPIVVIGIIAVFLLAMLVIQSLGIFDVTELFKKQETIKLEEGISISDRQVYILSNVFKTDGSAVYTVTMEAEGVAEDHKVYLDKGRARVESVGSSDYFIFDGDSYYASVNGIVKNIDKGIFDLKTSQLLPWAYLDLAKSATGATDLIVGGKSCMQFFINDAKVCISEQLGFPLQYKSADTQVLFKDVNINPQIQNSLFEI